MIVRVGVFCLRLLFGSRLRLCRLCRGQIHAFQWVASNYAAVSLARSGTAQHAPPNTVRGLVAEGQTSDRL
jgi:hypothetical protein